MTTITKTKTKKPLNRIVFWRASGCYKSPLAILETLENPNKELTLRNSGKPIFIRALENSKYSPKPDDLLINWGNGGFNTFDALKWTPIKSAPKLLNHPDSVAIASNKIKTFKALELNGVSCVKSTESKELATSWLKDKYTIIVRKTVTGCCGEGIEVVEPNNADVKQKLPDAPLYTRYMKKTHEYRVHVFQGKVINVTQKKLKKGLKSTGKIRNVDDGWKFSTQLSHHPEDLNQLGIDAIKACELDFGAVDIIWNKFYNKCYVLEVNTAPGLEIKETINAYAKAFLGVFND